MCSPWKQLGSGLDGDKLVRRAFTVAAFSGSFILLGDNGSGAGVVLKRAFLEGEKLAISLLLQYFTEWNLDVRYNG